MKNTPGMIVLAGPSGSGKTTLAYYLMEKLENLAFSISATTRKPRSNETNGYHYYFLSQSDFEDTIQNDGFLEYEEVYKGIYYGTLKSELARIRESGKIPLLDVDVEGALNIQKKYSDNCLFIFIHPVSEGKLRERLMQRGTESGDTLEERIARSKKEMQFAKYFDKIIYNDNLEEAQKEILKEVSIYTGNSTAI